MMYYTFNNSLFNNSQFWYGIEKEENYNTGEAFICPECNSALSMLEWLPSYEVTVSRKKIGDFIFGSFVGFIVSGRVKDEYEQLNLKSLGVFNKADLF